MAKMISVESGSKLGMHSCPSMWMAGAQLHELSALSTRLFADWKQELELTIENRYSSVDSGCY